MPTHRLHNLEAEQSVIGALLLDPLSSDRIGTLNPAHFYDAANRLIFTEILRMIGAGLAVDVVTVAEELMESGHEKQTGGLAYLGELVSNTPGSKAIAGYAGKVIGKAIERQLLAASESIRDTVTGAGSTKEKIASAQAAVMGITEAMTTNATRSLRDVLLSAAEVIEQRSQGVVNCLPTGFCDLDRQLGGGLRPGNLILVAGRPSMGKTALSVNIAMQAARDKHSTLFLSMEMTEQEISDRLIAQAGSVYLSDVIAGNMEGDPGERIMAAMSRLVDCSLHIDTQGGLTYFDVASKARSTKRQHGLDLLVIDYLQLMSGTGDNRNSQIEVITRSMKALAKELNVPIILLSQLSRDCDKRPNKRPMLSDLRDSGSIEQDADIVMFVYRDELYNTESPDKGTGEIIVGKNRQGQTGMVRMLFEGCYSRFADLPGHWMPAEQHRNAPYAVKRKGLSVA